MPVVSRALLVNHFAHRLSKLLKMDKPNEKDDVEVEVEEPLSSEGSFASTVAGQCCGEERERERYRKVEDEEDPEQDVQLTEVTVTDKAKGKQSPSELSGGHNYATSKNVAEGRGKTVSLFLGNTLITSTFIQVSWTSHCSRQMQISYAF